MPSANEIRQQFIDFFCRKHGHTFVPSSSVVPHDDPTLLFTNAGMNQFKDVFLGTGTRPYKRAANTQKCIRAGGKHNDLDDVGKDTYHHTFFEMLGNWSFGDYFKKEAIAWAWELLTEVWKLDKSRLHVTVFEGDKQNNIPRDDEAATYWRAAGVPEAQIHLGNKKDNFWEMGNTGPCGPCTEVHIDRTPDKSGARLVNKGTPDVIEIWNLVFIQFNRNDDQSLTPLPAQHVDTGMGFERITAVLQNKSSNYDTDVFMPIIDAISSLVNRVYGGALDDLDDVAFRVIADHIRMLVFAISDGALPSNKARGSVVRSVLRRAVRFGYQRFEQREPFLWKLVTTLVDQMREVYPEISFQPDRIERVIRGEEADFLQTIERGLGHFESAAFRAQNSKNEISGEDAFKLHETYGFPIDLTRQMAGERGLTIDNVEFERRHQAHESKSRSGAKKQNFQSITWPGNPFVTDDSGKYATWDAPLDATIQCWIKDNEAKFDEEIPDDETVALVLDRTNFYAEQGGQVGDKGIIASDTGEFQVEDTKKIGNTVLHIGRVTDGRLRNAKDVVLKVSPSRLDTMRNHTVTHLLNWALRKVLQHHVEQRGSLVDADKTRFDFTHDKPLTMTEIMRIEQLVNEKILADLIVTPVEIRLAEAKLIPGVQAVFGEKYPDPVRVIIIGEELLAAATSEDSVEFCGGTHLSRTSQASLFKIVGQEGVAKGVRRITAVTGPRAIAQVRQLTSVVSELSERFRCRPDELPARVEALQEEIKQLQQQLRKGVSSDLAGTMDKLLAAATKAGDVTIIVGEVPNVPDEALRTQVDRIKQKAGSAVVVVGWVNEDKVGLLAAVTEDVIKKGIKAGALVGEIAKIVGGGGGGKPSMAQAGGKDPAKLGEALQHARHLIEQQLAK